MAEITLRNYLDCYAYGKRVYNHELDMGTAAIQISKTGMGIGSARAYLYCVCAMLDGVQYKSTVKENATSYFLTSILADYGMDGLRKALNSVRLHLEYQRRYQNLNSIRMLYQDFWGCLPETPVE